MRMLLTSNGLQNEVTRDALIELLGTPTADARMVVVIDAILPYGGDKSGLIRNLTQLQSLGWAEFDVISLLAAPRHIVEERLRAADVIVGYGGSNLWLAHAWNSTGLASILPELLDEKVYVGWSAGSMIFSRHQAAAVPAFDDEDLEYFGLDETAPAAPLFDWFLMPHHRAEYFPYRTDEWAAHHASRLAGVIWFLDDESALLVRDPNEEPEVISSGAWLRFDGSGTVVDSRA